MKHKSPMLSLYMKESNAVAVDFDGTLTLDGVSLDKGAKKYIPRIKNLGVDLVLWTCRCDERYTYAVNKIKDWGLPIYTIDDMKWYEPEEPRKISCIYYIDDRAVPGGKVNWRRTYKFIKKEVRKMRRSN